MLLAERTLQHLAVRVARQRQCAPDKALRHLVVGEPLGAVPAQRLAVGVAIAKANETIRNIHWFELKETRGHVVDGKVAHWQVTMKLGFTLE